MTLEEALVSSNPPPLPDFVVYDTISATPLQQNGFIKPSMAFDGEGGGSGGRVMGEEEMLTKRKRRRRRQRRCKNKEEEENQRMTHIAVERNRRRLMNEHLAVLRSLMPPSYIQRGDQASVVGGAIDFVKGLEQLQQSLEAQKRTLQLQKKASTASSSSSSGGGQNVDENEQNPPFSHFFAYPHQYLRCHTSPPSMPDSGQSVVVGDIQVNLIETHANLRILTLRRPQQLLKMCAKLQTLGLSILHLNVVTTLESLVLYSISAKQAKMEMNSS